MGDGEGGRMESQPITDLTDVQGCGAELNIGEMRDERQLPGGSWGLRVLLLP